MSQDEINEFLKKLENYKRKVSENEAEASKFLKSIRILTKQGKVRKIYQDICIQQDQA
jgi:hypothetical protein